MDTASLVWNVWVALVVLSIVYGLAASYDLNRVYDPERRHLLLWGLLMLLPLIGVVLVLYALLTPVLSPERTGIMSMSLLVFGLALALGITQLSKLRSALAYGAHAD